MAWFALMTLGCGPSDDGPGHHATVVGPTAATGDSGAPVFTGSNWTDLTASCTTPEDEPAAPECTLAADDWLVMCEWPGQDDAESSWTGHFTAFDGQSAIHFDPTDGSAPPSLVVFGSVGSWRRAPDLVSAGEVTVHTLGGCGDSFSGQWLTVVTDASGATLFVVGQTAHGSVAGWSVEPGSGAGSCPMYVAPQPACQACQSNVPLHVTGPGFDAEAWQSQSVQQGPLELLVGSAWVGSGLLCGGQSVDLYNWIVGPPPDDWTFSGP